ncbi:type VI secretion system lipoprotein TssJ [Silvimonas iriomotensis]|nr:type VI secretion system lipoprotein TssJ [Silvimonas iriomotensis]
MKPVPCLAALSLALLLGACGAVQTVKQASVSTARAIFIAQTLTLKLDLVARESINSDDKDQPMSVVVRVYQLKDGKALQDAPYDKILADDNTVLKDTLVARKELLLRPGATVSLDEPLDQTTQAVGVAVFFRKENKDNTWHVMIPRADLSDDKPVRLSVTGYTIKRDPPPKANT